MPLFIDNDHFVKLDGLKNGLTGDAISDATVSVTLYDATGTTAVPGVSWPLALSPIDGEAGSYAAVMDKAVEVSRDTQYVARVVVGHDASGLDGSWDEVVIAGRRSEYA